MHPHSSWRVLVPRTIAPLNLLVKTRLLAPSTEGLSGADIAFLCQQTKFEAVSGSDFKVGAEIQPDVGVDVRGDAGLG